MLTWSTILSIAVKGLGVLHYTLIPSHCIQVDIERLLFSLAVKWHKFWSPKIDKKVINSDTKCLISVKIAILTPHIIPPPLVMFGWYLICRNMYPDFVNSHKDFISFKMGVCCMLKQTVWAYSFLCKQYLCSLQTIVIFNNISTMSTATGAVKTKVSLSSRINWLSIFIPRNLS